MGKETMREETMRIILIIGALGIVGKSLVQFLTLCRFKVTVSDKDTSPAELSAKVKVANAIFLCVPIPEIVKVLGQILPSIRKGQLIVSMASIECLAGLDKLIAELQKRGASFVHLHFHFRPQAPLSVTVFGQAMTIILIGEQKWSIWLRDLFSKYGARVIELERGEHDKITIVSQLFHMMIAVLKAYLDDNMEAKWLNLATDLGGLPFKLIKRACDRVAFKPVLPADIIANHPYSLDLLGLLQRSLNSIEYSIKNDAPRQYEQVLGQLNTKIDKTRQDQWDQTTEIIARVEADLCKNYVILPCGKEANQPGLLTAVLEPFKKYGINLTTTIAVNLPTGGCSITIGYDGDELIAQKAIAEAKSVIEDWTSNR